MVVDARGCACPKPVLMTKEALEGIEEGIVEVLVDNPASKENVARFAQKQGCSLEIKEEEWGYRLIITKGYACSLPQVEDKTTSDKVMIFLSDSMGEDRELGQILIRAFIATLRESSVKPKKLIFINRGVYLTTEGSKVADVLKELEREGVEILSCGTCLEYFGLKDKLVVGSVTNMYDTVESLLGSASVVRI